MAQTFSNYQNSFTGTDEADSVTLENGGGTIDMGAGNDALWVTGGYVGDVSMGEGSDLFFLENGATAGSVDLGDGTNTVFASDGGYIQTLTGGDDTDNVTLGNGAGSVDLGAGDNQLFATGYVNSVTTGDGVDNVQLNDGGNTVDLGAGNDIFRASAYVNDVDTGAGDDTIETSNGGVFDGGADDDTFNFDFADANGSNTRFDGGTGSDTLNINVDSFDDLDFSQLSADLATYAQDGSATLSQFNFDIENVETINVTVGSQTIETYDYGDIFG